MHSFLVSMVVCTRPVQSNVYKHELLQRHKHEEIRESSLTSYSHELVTTCCFFCEHCPQHTPHRTSPMAYGWLPLLYFLSHISIVRPKSFRITSFQLWIFGFQRSDSNYQLLTISFQRSTPTFDLNPRLQPSIPNHQSRSFETQVTYCDDLVGHSIASMRPHG